LSIEIDIYGTGLNVAEAACSASSFMQQENQKWKNKNHDS
jgi:hypothetical protein